MTTKETLQLLACIAGSLLALMFVLVMLVALTHTYACTGFHEMGFGSGRCS